MVTWRLALLLAVCAPLPALVPAPWLAVIAVTAGIALVDAGGAAPLSAVTLSRDGDTTLWLGQTATVTLTVGNGARCG